MQQVNSLIKLILDRELSLKRHAPFTQHPSTGPSFLGRASSALPSTHDGVSPLIPFGSKEESSSPLYPGGSEVLRTTREGSNSNNPFEKIIFPLRIPVGHSGNILKTKSYAGGSPLVRSRQSTRISAERGTKGHEIAFKIEISGRLQGAKNGMANKFVIRSGSGSGPDFLRDVAKPSAALAGANRDFKTRLLSARQNSSGRGASGLRLQSINSRRAAPVAYAYKEIWTKWGILGLKVITSARP